MPTDAGPKPATIGELRAAGHPDRTVKEELRENLLTKLERGESLFPSIVGFDESVIGRSTDRTPTEEASMTVRELELLEAFLPWSQV
jgi:hypothetical protein